MGNIILGPYVKIKTGKLDANASEKDGIYPFFTCAREISKINTYAFDCECVLVAGNGELNAKYYNGKFNAYQRTYVIEVIDKSIISTKFLYYFIDRYIARLRNDAIGGVIKYIKMNNLTDIELTLPELETQNKIVAILDKAKSLIEKREETITLYDNLLNAIFSEMFGNSYKNSKHWDIVPLHEVITDIDAGWSPVCEGFPRSNSNQFAVLKLGAISKRVFDASENKLLPPNVEIKKNIQARIGDVLFSRKNTKELVGATVYLFEDYENLLLPDTVFNLKYDKSKVSGVYLYFLFNDNLFRKTIQNLSSGAAASMLNISQEKLLNHKIPLPPITEQLAFEEFVKKVNFKHLSNIRKSKDLFQQLLNSISQRAFSGKQLFDIEIELSSLINAIDIEKKDSENNIETIKKDVIFLQRLLDKLNELDFENKEQYDKAKYIVFRIMKEEGNLIKQVFEDSQILLTLKNEIA